MKEFSMNIAVDVEQNLFQVSLHDNVTQLKFSSKDERRTIVQCLKSEYHHILRMIEKNEQQQHYRLIFRRSLFDVRVGGLCAAIVCDFTGGPRQE